MEFLKETYSMYSCDNDFVPHPWSCAMCVIYKEIKEYDQLCAYIRYYKCIRSFTKVGKLYTSKPFTVSPDQVLGFPVTVTYLERTQLFIFALM